MASLTDVLSVVQNGVVAFSSLGKQLTESIAGTSFISGLILSTPVGTQFNTSPGNAADSTGSVYMTLATTLRKNTGLWQAGDATGSFDGTGPAPSATVGWYHVHLIKRQDTGAVDILTSNSAIAPTLPTNYTIFRRIGSLLTNGSFQWTPFTQVGNEFHWAANAVDLVWSATNVGTTTAFLQTMTVPTGVQVNALFHAGLTPPSSASLNSAFLFTSTDENDILPDSIGGNFNCSLFASAGTVGTAGDFQKRTNTSAQIRIRSNIGNSGLGIYTFGWIDPRGTK